MSAGFSVVAQIAGTLIGLVAVALVFAYSSASQQLSVEEDLTCYRTWIWASGYANAWLLIWLMSFSIAYLFRTTNISSLIGFAIPITILACLLIFNESKANYELIKRAYHEPKVRKEEMLGQLLVIFLFSFGFFVSLWFMALKLHSAKSAEEIRSIGMFLIFALTLSIVRVVLLIGMSSKYLMRLRKNQERTKAELANTEKAQ